MTSPVSWLDCCYRRLVASRFFVDGWGKPQDLLRLMLFRREMCDKTNFQTALDENYPIHIDKVVSGKHFRVVEGHFTSPVAHHFPDLVIPPVSSVQFQMVLPSKWSSERKRPMCIHFAGTGDHYFWRRRTLLAEPLAAKANIGSVILENPFYILFLLYISADIPPILFFSGIADEFSFNCFASHGSRRPLLQKRSSLRKVIDLFIMGACLVFEGAALLNWLTRAGFGPLALTGISMGGHMASLAAAAYPKAVALIPCLSWSTASPVFTQGVMSNGICWDLLRKEYMSTEFRNCDLVSLLEKGSADQLLAVTKENLPSVVQAAANKVLPSGVPTDDVHLFMWRLMDEFTHLQNFPKPADTSLIVVVVALHDAYVPLSGAPSLKDIWPEAQFRYVPKGHVGAYLFEQKMFRKAIVDAIEKAGGKGYQSAKAVETEELLF